MAVSAPFSISSALLLNHRQSGLGFAFRLFMVLAVGYSDNPGFVVIGVIDGSGYFKQFQNFAE